MSLLEYAIQNAFYMFSWNFYFSNEIDAKEKSKIDLKIDKLNLINKKMISIDKLIDLFESDASLNADISKNLQNLPEKYVKAKSARVILKNNSLFKINKLTRNSNKIWKNLG